MDSTGQNHKGNGEEEANIRVVSPEELQDVRNGKVEISIPEDIGEIILPGNAGALLDGYRLIVTNGEVRIELPGELLRGAVTDATGNDEMLISLQLTPLPASRIERLINEASAQAHARLNAASEAYEIGLTLVQADGSRNPVRWPDDAGESSSLSFASSAHSPTIAFKLPLHMDQELLGIYRMDSNGKLHYAGGKANQDWIVTAAVHPGQYVLVEYDKTFADVAEDFWAARVIKMLAARHIVEGVDDTHFAPMKPVTRAEFTALLVRSLGLQAEGEGLSTFSDVAADAWYREAVAAAAASGLVNGISDDLFAPDDLISREQMAAMLVRGYEIAANQQLFEADVTLQPSQTSFADQSEISDWALLFVKKSQELDLLQGKDHNRFDPLNETVRAESAQAIYNLMKFIK